MHLVLARQVIRQRFAERLLRFGSQRFWQLGFLDGGLLLHIIELELSISIEH